MLISRTTDNPETYSTDFDVADKLYFDELSYERVMDIYELECASGVVVSVGGQLPQNIALRLQETGKAKILGTDPNDIDKAEDRHKFSSILDSIGVDQPAWKELTSYAEAQQFANDVGYPVLVRPSYVLSGAAMTVIHSEDQLKDKLTAASDVSPDHPVVISQFISGAQEIDVDAVASSGELLIHAVSEHVENAGVHSGDASLILPPAKLDQRTLERVKEIAQKVAKAWKITGPFNMQIIKAASEGDEPALKVIECNLRASRSFPFVSKVLGHNFIDVATRALAGRDVPAPVDLMATKRDYLAVKVPQFSWTRLAGADPYLGVEMSSTGEMACFGKDLIEAYWSAMQSTMNFRLPLPGEGLLFGGDVSEGHGAELAQIAAFLRPLGYKLFAANHDVKNFLETIATEKSASDETVEVEVIDFPKTDKRALREVFQRYNVRGVFNLATARASSLVDEDYVMRRNAVDFGVPLFMEPKVRFLLFSFSVLLPFVPFCSALLQIADTSSRTHRRPSSSPNACPSRSRRARTALYPTRCDDGASSSTESRCDAVTPIWTYGKMDRHHWGNRPRIEENRALQRARRWSVGATDPRGRRFCFGASPAEERHRSTKVARSWENKEGGHFPTVH